MTLYGTFALDFAHVAAGATAFAAGGLCFHSFAPSVSPARGRMQTLVEKWLPAVTDQRLRTEGLRRGLSVYNRPKVGCGVLILSPDHPGCVLLGRRRGAAAGQGMWAVPGGHVELGESFEVCAAREALEETGLELCNLRQVTTTNTYRPNDEYHYVVGFVVAEASAGAVPKNCEPDKCESWRWVHWEEGSEWSEPIFHSLQTFREQGFSPFDTFPEVGSADGEPSLPAWTASMATSTEYKQVLMREWEDEIWRKSHGWQGSDLIHGRDSAVRVVAYWWNATDQTLVGVVHFSSAAESHRGLCHGGAMTSVLDDVLGHTCFMAGAGPWCGATVKLDVTLKAPVPVGSTLRVVGRIVERKASTRGRFKVRISARLEDGEGEILGLGASTAKESQTTGPPVVCYAEMSGLSIEGVRLPSSVSHDEIDMRKWLSTKTPESSEYRDSGWNMK